MSAEDRSAKARGPQHVTHHDDCGCLSARYEAQIASLEHDEATLLEDADYMRQRISTLESERGEWRTAAGREIAIAYAHANALRDALEDGNRRLGYWCGLHGSLPEDVAALGAMQAALAQTPAQSLAAHDAEVLERARDAAHNAIHDAVYEMGECTHVKAAVDEAIRALAAQAATHSVPDGTSEVKS